MHPAEDSLHDYLDDELDAAERRDVAEHLAHCSDCAARVAEIGAAIRAVASLPSVANVESPILSSGTAHPPGPSLSLGMTGRIAAALVLFVAGAAFGTWRERHRPVLPQTPAVLEVQRAGSEYVAAVARTATSNGPSAEVALGPVQAVARELVKKSPTDPDYQALLALARHLRARAAQPPTISF
jgi:anti-sigma factor RsiW